VVNITTIIENGNSIERDRESMVLIYADGVA